MKLGVGDLMAEWQGIAQMRERERERHTHTHTEIESVLAVVLYPARTASIKVAGIFLLLKLFT